MLLVILCLISPHDFNPASAAINTVKTGIKMTNRILKSPAVKKVKQGTQLLNTAAKNKEELNDFWDILKEIFKGNELDF